MSVYPIQNPKATYPQGGGFMGTLNWHKNGWENTYAVDIGENGIGVVGQKLYAVVSGDLISGFLGGGYNEFYIKGDDGKFYIYLHCNSHLADGRVNEGQIIGEVGSTGAGGAGNAHLHFAVCNTLQEVNAGGGGNRDTPQPTLDFFANAKSPTPGGATAAVPGQPSKSGNKTTPPKPKEPTWKTKDRPHDLDLIPYAISVTKSNNHVFWVQLDRSKTNISGEVASNGGVTDTYNQTFNGYVVYNQFHEELTTKTIAKIQSIPSGRPVTINVKSSFKKVDIWSLINDPNVVNELLNNMKDERWTNVSSILAQQGWHVDTNNSQYLTSVKSYGKPIKHNDRLHTDNQYPPSTKDAKYNPQLVSTLSKPPSINGNSSNPTKVTATREDFWKMLKDDFKLPLNVIYGISKNVEQESTYKSNVQQGGALLDKNFDFANYPDNSGVGLYQFSNFKTGGELKVFLDSIQNDGEKAISGYEQTKYVLARIGGNPSYKILSDLLHSEMANNNPNLSDAANVCSLWVQIYERPFDIPGQVSKRCSEDKQYWNDLNTWYKNN